MAQKDEKAERLAAALRENLRRRKTQAREKDAPKGEGKKGRFIDSDPSSRT